MTAIDAGEQPTRHPNAPTTVPPSLSIVLPC
jgi:hypothetical protein